MQNWTTSKNKLTLVSLQPLGGLSVDPHGSRVDVLTLVFCTWWLLNLKMRNWIRCINHGSVQRVRSYSYQWCSSTPVRTNHNSQWKKLPSKTLCPSHPKDQSLGTCTFSFSHWIQWFSHIEVGQGERKVIHMETRGIDLRKEENFWSLWAIVYTHGFNIA